MIVVDRTRGVRDRTVRRPGVGRRSRARHLRPGATRASRCAGRPSRTVEDAFAEAWAAAGDPLPATAAAGRTAPRRRRPETSPCASSRRFQTRPGCFASISSSPRWPATALWLTDAYFAGTTPYVQALRAAAQDGVDVRLLVPGASDIPLLRPLSRAGYRPLLEAGVRVFEWNGSMLHAKTAVADGRGRASDRPISISPAGSATASST